MEDGVDKKNVSWRERINEHLGSRNEDERIDRCGQMSALLFGSGKTNIEYYVNGVGSNADLLYKEAIKQSKGVDEGTEEDTILTKLIVYASDIRGLENRNLQKKFVSNGSEFLKEWAAENIAVFRPLQDEFRRFYGSKAPDALNNAVSGMIPYLDVLGRSAA